MECAIAYFCYYVGNNNIGNTRVAAECVVSDDGNASVGGNDAILKSVEKCFGFDLDETVVDKSVVFVFSMNAYVKLCAVCEYTASDAYYTCGDIDVFQAGTVIEGSVSYKLYAFVEGHVFKRSASAERKIANASDASGNGYCFEALTTAECGITDACYTVGDNDTFKA